MKKPVKQTVKQSTVFYWVTSLWTQKNPWQFLLTIHQSLNRWQRTLQVTAFLDWMRGIEEAAPDQAAMTSRGVNICPLRRKFPWILDDF
jgi:hypothetical protein